MNKAAVNAQREKNRSDLLYFLNVCITLASLNLLVFKPTVVINLLTDHRAVIHSLLVHFGWHGFAKTEAACKKQPHKR